MLQKITMFYGKILYKWPFSIAMFVYQRVSMAFPFFWTKLFFGFTCRFVVGGH